MSNESVEAAQQNWVPRNYLQSKMTLEERQNDVWFNLSHRDFHKTLISNSCHKSCLKFYNFL